MSSARSVKRLAVSAREVCRDCRRTFATSTRQSQQQPMTGLADALLKSANRRNQTDSRSAAPTTTSRPTQPTRRSRGSSGHDFANSTIMSIAESRAQQKRVEQAAEMQQPYTRADLDLQVHRRWNAGDIYAPHDLTGVEMNKWKAPEKQTKVKYDVLDRLGIDPMKHYTNFSIMSEYISETGRIKHSNVTGLRPVNQRKMARAIRRAIGIGLMPATHRHPEIMQRQMQKSRDRF